MKIGVPKEIKVHEYRVGLTPSSVREVVAHGHAVLVQAPIIVTFHAPSDPAYEFRAFYAKVRARGYILYPGKLTQVETFRVGCIGAIDANEMRNVVSAIGATLQDMGIGSAAPALRAA